MLEGKNRIMAIAAIHQRLYQKEALDTLELKTFAEDIFKQIRDIYAGDEKQVVFENRIDELHAGIDRAVLLGLILNELFTNSFKYAFNTVAAPRIILESKSEDRKYTMIYRDNGPGLKKDIDIKALSSLGINLITGLTEQLGGEVSYFYGDGFCMKFFFTDGEDEA